MSVRTAGNFRSRPSLLDLRRLWGTQLRAMRRRRRLQQRFEVLTQCSQNLNCEFAGKAEPERPRSLYKNRKSDLNSRL